MSNSMNIKLQDSSNVFLNKTNEKIDKNYRNEPIWHVLKNFDTNQNEKLETIEINDFIKTILKFAGEDKVLNNDEVKQLAVSMDVSEQDLKKAITLLSSDILADNLISTFNVAMMKKVDTKKAEELLAQIDKNNVSEVWDYYQSMIDNKNSFLGFLVRDTSLANDILENYSYKDAAKLLKKLVTVMYQAAKERGIDVSNLIKNYNTALLKGDKKGIDAAIRELSSRLNYNTRMNKDINNHIALMNGAKINNTNLEHLKSMSQKSNIEITDDIIGDGVLGNTPSKALTEEGRVILNAINELMQDETMKEKINACFTKKDNCFEAYFPNANAFVTLTEYGLVTEDVVKNGVIGDGDMSFLVYSIQRYMTVNKDNLENIQDIKQYIQDLFKPELFGRTRLFTTH